MNALGSLRRRRSLARSVLAMFCFAWLQLAALPCAMSAEPPEGKASASGPNAHLHAGTEPAQADCLHCPTLVADDAPDCVTQDVAGSCADVDTGVDVRSTNQTQLEKLSAHAALLDPGAFGLLRVLRTPGPTPRPTASVVVPSRSLNLQNCVQLR